MGPGGTTPRLPWVEPSALPVIECCNGAVRGVRMLGLLLLGDPAVDKDGPLHVTVMPSMDGMTGFTVLTRLAVTVGVVCCRIMLVDPCLQYLLCGLPLICLRGEESLSFLTDTGERCLDSLLTAITGTDPLASCS
jgi:hypothetical protein